MTVWTYSILVDLFTLLEASPLAAVPPGGAVVPVRAPASVPTVQAASRPAPEDLHPALWRAHQVGRQPDTTWPTGFALLDAELPGGGWPARSLTELLLPHPGIGEMRLLAPVMAAVQRGQRCVMLFDPPAAPCGWVLGAFGIDVQQLVVVRGRDGLKGRARELLPAADTLWALEQALKSGHVGAVLAWLPVRLRADALRRLQLAAQAHDGPAFLLRDVEARLKPSASPLRLLLGAAGPDALRLRLLKRRGPPLQQPLTLTLAPVLSEPVSRRALHLAAPQWPNATVASDESSAAGVSA